jgi:hypothetical protein
MSAYCPCPGIDVGIELEFAVGAAPGGGGAGGVAVEEMCPSIGASDEASKMAPMTIRITGYVLPNSK